MPAWTIRELEERDQRWVARFMTEHWGAEIVVSKGKVYRPHSLPGFVAERDGNVLGLVTYDIKDAECEIVTLDSLYEGHGIGTGLIEAVKAAARGAGCKRLWLITTNDNLHALRFYQKRGFALVAVHRNAIEASRKLKPGISLIGMDGIPIRDEVELELMLV